MSIDVLETDLRDYVAQMQPRKRSLNLLVTGDLPDAPERYQAELSRIHEVGEVLVAPGKLDLNSFAILVTPADIYIDINSGKVNPNKPHYQVARNLGKQPCVFSRYNFGTLRNFMEIQMNPIKTVIATD